METTKTPMLGRPLLIVEDDVLIAMALQDALNDAGYQVLHLTGRHLDAISVAKECKPDLALVNIDLQGHDDGIALAQELKAMGIPSLFISGQISRARSARTAAIGSLPKPYSPAEMVMAVAHLLSRLNGGETLPRPINLEIFGEAHDEVAPQVS